MVASIAKATFGTMEYDKDSSDEDIDGISVDIADLFGLMQELSETIAQINALSKVVDKVITEVSLKVPFLCMGVKETIHGAGGGGGARGGTINVNLTIKYN